MIINDDMDIITRSFFFQPTTIDFVTDNRCLPIYFKAVGSLGKEAKIRQIIPNPW